MISRPELNPPNQNPFLIRDVFAVRGNVRYRTFEFDAKDEAEVRRLYTEAQKQRLPNVVGFDLCSITEITSKKSDA
jgi:hypothetical protein